MFVRLWMTRDPVTVPPQTKVRAAITRMQEGGFRHLPVVQDGRFIGFVTLADLDRAGAGALDDEVRGHLVRGLVHIDPYLPLEDAIKLLRERKFGGMPVVSKGRLVGVLTESDVHDAFLAALSGDEGAARVTFDGPDQPRILRRALLLCEKHGLEIQSFLSHLRGADEGRRLFAVRALGSDYQEWVEELWKQGFRVLQVVLPKDAARREAGAGGEPVEARLVLESTSATQAITWIGKAAQDHGLDLCGLTIKPHPGTAGHCLVSLHAKGRFLQRFLAALEQSGLTVVKQQLQEA